MKECKGDKCKKIEALKKLIVLVIILVIMTLPQVSSMFLSQTFQKSLYPDNTLVITTRPEASFPQDWKYCYIGENELKVHVVFHNYDGSHDLMDMVDEQLALADISFSYTFTDLVETPQVYFDFEYEPKMDEYRVENDADYVLVFTNLLTPRDGIYDNLGGYARVQNHFAVVFTSRLSSSNYVSAIALHEMCHLLGYWHADDPDDVMYPTYTGYNNEFTQTTIDDLYELHH